MSILAWHFTETDKMPRTGKPLVAGRTYTVEPPIELCKRGMHASRRAIDALDYSGPWVSRVECGGEVVEGSDKLVCTDRKIISIIDATQILHEFACWCAEQELLSERAAGREPDARSWAAIEAKRKWLRGEIDDAQLDAAWDAAWDAAAAAWDAAAAACAAARDAAWDAAWDAAAAAGDAARDAQNAKLESMLLVAMGLEEATDEAVWKE